MDTCDILYNKTLKVQTSMFNEMSSSMVQYLEPSLAFFIYLLLTYVAPNIPYICLLSFMIVLWRHSPLVSWTQIASEYQKFARHWSFTRDQILMKEKHVRYARHVDTCFSHFVPR